MRFAGVDSLWSRLCITGSSARRPPVGRNAAAAGRADGSACAGLQVGGHLGEGAVLVGADAAEEQVTGLPDSLPGHHYRRTQFARAISGWTDQECQAFAHLLTRFVTALDQPGPGTPGA